MPARGVGIQDALTYNILPVVMVALDHYESLKETAHPLGSQENARRLLASIDRLEHGGGVVHDLAR